MKTTFALATLGLVLAVSSAEAQRTPPDMWCRDQALDRGSVLICSAYTYQQCMASRTPGDSACFLNPRYDQRFRR
jgi:hypothetical protein